MSGGNVVTPTSTSALARVMLYQPSQRPQHRAGDWTDTSFGRCRVVGRLGQRHADVMDAILYCSERKRVVDDGGIELLVDPARLRKTLSESRYSLSQLEKLLAELRAATITIETPQFDFPIIGGLIDHVVPSEKTRPNPLTGGGAASVEGAARRCSCNATSARFTSLLRPRANCASRTRHQPSCSSARFEP